MPGKLTVVTTLPFHKCKCFSCALARLRMDHVLAYDAHKYDHLHAEDEVEWNFRPNCICSLCIQVVEDIQRWSDEYERGDEYPCVY